MQLNKNQAAAVEYQRVFPRRDYWIYFVGANNTKSVIESQGNRYALFIGKIPTLAFYERDNGRMLVCNRYNNWKLLNVWIGMKHIPVGNDEPIFLPPDSILVWNNPIRELRIFINGDPREIIMGRMTKWEAIRNSEDSDVIQALEVLKGIRIPENATSLALAIFDKIVKL